MKKTSKAVLSSVVSVAVCASLIAGSTFALFSSENSVNIAVTSGKVDLEATVTGVDAYSAKWESAQNDYVDEPVEPTDMHGTFTNGGTYAYNAENKTLTLDRVSPGDGVKLSLRIVNKSSIKTKYRFEVSTTEDNGLLAGLETSYTFTAGEGAGEEIAFTDYETYRFSAWTELEAVADGEAEVGTAEVTVELPVTAGNAYNPGSGEALTCTLNVSVHAVQSNANIIDYLAWDGVSKATDEELTEAIDEAAHTLNVEKPAVLAALAEKVNSGTASDYEDYEWKLGASMDLSAAEENWTPVGTREHPFEGTFNGNGNVLKGIEVSEEQTYDGVFGYTKGATISDVTISGGEFHGKPDSTGGLNSFVGVLAGHMENSTVTNVTIDGVKVVGTTYASLLVGQATTGKIEGCTVKNSYLVTSSQYSGGIYGDGYASIKNCTVENSTIEYTSTVQPWKVGGVVGQWNEGALSMEGVTVRGLTLKLPSSAKDCGIIVGFSNIGDKTFTDCHVIDCTIENTDQASNSYLANVGGFIGGYGDSGNGDFTSTVTFDRCSVENLKMISMGGFNYFATAYSVGGFVGNAYSNQSPLKNWTLTFLFKNCSSSVTAAVGEGKNADRLGAFLGSYSGTGVMDLGSAIYTKTTTVKFEGENTYSGCEKSVGYDMDGKITIDGTVTKK